MRHRYTMEELESLSDYELLYSIVLERRSDCTNYYSPLATRLGRLSGKLNRKEKLSK